VGNRRELTMRKSVAGLLLAGVAGLSFPQVARAGASEDAALALGAFAVFNQIVTGQTIFHHFGRQAPAVVHYAPPPPVAYAPPPPVVYAPPPSVVYVYPHHPSWVGGKHHHWKDHHHDRGHGRHDWRRHGRRW
jgi:hypothetical protein